MSSNSNSSKQPSLRSTASTQAPPDLEPTHTNEEDLDYSTAFRREVFRRQKSEQYFKRKNLEEDLKKPKISNGGFVNLPQMKFDDPTVQNNAIFDVLPSFEMYHSLQFNTPREYTDNSSLRDFPPDYTDPDAESTGLDILVSSTSTVDLIHSTNQSTVTSEGSQLDPNTPGINARNGTADYTDKNIVDNYHKFPQLDVPGLNIKIHVTKNVPTPHTKNENESSLKEYTSGDIVHGYVIIENNSEKDIPFYGFYVTLQGTISVIDLKSKKQILKNFLSMVDLSASWSYACISTSAVNQNYKYGSCDKIDGAEFGLRNDRILEKGVKYKKYFTFKFPYTLLDTSCKHDQPLHLLLPPSLGFNKLYKRGKYSDIQIDPFLNYGLNSSHKGSPIITRDLSDDLVSVNYSINAALITNEGTAKGLRVLKHQEFFLRFIPFGFNESLFSSKVLLKHFKKVIEMNLKQCENFFNGEYKPKILIHENTASLNSRSNTGKLSQGQFPLRNEDEIPTEVHKTITFSTKPSFLSKKQVSHGLISISSTIPKDGLPYIVPSLIQKLNDKSKLNERGYENLNNMLTTLTNTERKVLDKLNINLSFQTSQSSVASASTSRQKSIDDSKILPKLESVDVDLVAMNIFSNTNIPIKLSADIFIDQDHNSNNDILHTFKSQFITYQTQYDEHKRKFDELEMDIDRFFAPSVYNDLQSINGMTCSSTVIKRVFSCKSKQTDWEKETNQEGNTAGTNIYHKEVSIKLDLMKNIAETLIPNFQSCLLSRFYLLRVKLGFNNGISTDLKIPIRLRKFDDF